MASHSTQCISKFTLNNKKTKGAVFIGPPGTNTHRNDVMCCIEFLLLISTFVLAYISFLQSSLCGVCSHVSAMNSNSVTWLLKRQRDGLTHNRLTCK